MREVISKRTKVMLCFRQGEEEMGGVGLDASTCT